MRATFGIGHLIVGEQHIIDQSKTIDEVNGIAVLRLPSLRHLREQRVSPPANHR